MMTAGSAIMMTLTHYATGTSPIIFGSGYATMGTWWRVGFVMYVLELLVFATVGTTWWKLLGYWQGCRQSFQACISRPTHRPVAPARS